MKVAFQERAFEGYMNVAIDNYLRDYKILGLYVPSQQDEKKLGYDMSYGKILFIQYKSIYQEFDKKTGLSLYTQHLYTKNTKNKIKQQQCQTLLNLATQGINLCSVFYVFPHTHEFDQIQKDYFFHRKRSKHGTGLLECAIFISLKDIDNLNICNNKLPYEYDCTAEKATIDGNPIDIYNFYTWAKWAGYDKYESLAKNFNKFCNICGCPPPLPSNPNNGGDFSFKYKWPLGTINKIIQESDFDDTVICKEDNNTDDNPKEGFDTAKKAVAEKYQQIAGKYQQIAEYQKIYFSEDGGKIKRIQNFLDASKDFLLEYFGIKIYVALEPIF